MIDRSRVRIPAVAATTEWWVGGGGGGVLKHFTVTLNTRAKTRQCNKLQAMRTM